MLCRLVKYLQVRILEKIFLSHSKRLKVFVKFVWRWAIKIIVLILKLIAHTTLENCFDMKFI